MESGFFIVKWETDGARNQLEHYSLEGIMQCKEHERLKAVVYGKKINDLVGCYMSYIDFDSYSINA